ncbi:unnamed protein product [Protopolystoma xenopodis]|uniref:Uncharacterized protein n=1 Tax=Protopolystoma xenopodis TaxID=117903 RepID=A0A3S5BT94_9PLAT|nr:unnamed protein product [Protopolystoma xenopodis]
MELDRAVNSKFSGLSTTSAEVRILNLLVYAATGGPYTLTPLSRSHSITEVPAQTSSPLDESVPIPVQLLRAKNRLTGRLQAATVGLDHLEQEVLQGRLTLDYLQRLAGPVTRSLVGLSYLLFLLGLFLYDTQASQIRF